MVAKTSILKELETIYGKSGNQLYVLYGRTDSEKEQLLKAFLSDKKYFYYRCRQASGQEQRKQMETEIRQKFSANITKHSYDEFFNRIKSGDASKLVVVIDEFQLIAKKDASFMESIEKLRMKRLYPGPVLTFCAVLRLHGWNRRCLQHSVSRAKELMERLRLIL